MLRKNVNVENAALRQAIEPKGEPLLLRQEGGRLHVTFNRPERRNALNDAMLLALDRLIARLETESSVRVVIFRGAGGHFCAGGDIKER
ncbi:enoyl-CoA hydratase/isomerase family protein, partial [Klebsiella pneumoniae]|uniref:enoyl-CoA hydratase/isomerase family protein n=1 Tax=Klebsiella pneumoniae TaxID=573 RepID=UPI0013D53973